MAGSSAAVRRRSPELALVGAGPRVLDILPETSSERLSLLAGREPGAHCEAVAEDLETLPHGHEPHAAGLAGRLNWLRAGVLGANDGIVSVAGIVVGVAGATAARGPIFTAGLAGLVAGAVSMALGEYVSVSSQRDSETRAAGQGARASCRDPRAGAGRAGRDLPGEGAARGDRPRRWRVELTEHDALAAHARRRAAHRPRRPGQPGAGGAGVGGGVHGRGAAAVAGDPAAAARPGGSRSRRRGAASRWRSPARSAPGIGGSDAAPRGAARGARRRAPAWRSPTAIGHLFGTAIG